MPSLSKQVVSVRLVLRDDLVEQALKVAHGSRLELQGGHGSRRSGSEDGHRAGLETRLAQQGVDLVGEVHHVALAPGGEVQVVRAHGERPGHGIAARPRLGRVWDAAGTVAGDDGVMMVSFCPDAG